MRKLFTTFIFAILLSVTATAQEQLNWTDFADVEFKPTYNEKYGIEFLMPTFGDIIKSYDGKSISITGYFLDISGNGRIFLLSQNPMAACFFCGGSGPETIIEVNFKEKPPYKTDQVVTITGVLQLNEKDVDHCNYILQDAVGKLVN